MRKNRRSFVAASIFLPLVIVAAYSLRSYVSAALLLLQLQSGVRSGPASFLAHNVEERTISIPQSSGSLIPARLYVPVGVSSPPAMLLVHGVHYLGMNEPRLVSFARNFAQRGVLVMTPDLSELKDYKIVPGSIAEIGAAAQNLATQTNRKVGVMGLSFAGSLSLLAAAGSRYAPSIAFVAAIGAYDDLARVSRFLITGDALLPNGRVAHLEPEQYGELVLVYQHPENFFSQNDLPIARQALRLWLSEHDDAARSLTRTLSTKDRAILEDLFRYQNVPIQSLLKSEIAEHMPEMEAVSPHGKLASLQVPVFLIHGEQDAVIPSSETRWLSREVPAADLRAVLITPLIGHVDATSPHRSASEWQLVSFMARIFRQLEQEPSATVKSD